MPDLYFEVVGVESAFKGITPLMQFVLDVRNRSAERIQSVILQAQIRIEPARRTYDDGEKERLVELFGAPERWGQTVRTMLWTHAGVTIPSFEDRTQAKLPVQVTFDLNVAAAKYFYGLEDGDIPLIFLFSGTVFYTAADGRLLMQRISWENECRFQMPVGTWQALMQAFYPNSSWIYLQRDVFESLYAFKRRNGLPTWEAAVYRLLEAARTEAPL